MRKRLSVKKIILNTVPVLLLLALLYYFLGFTRLVEFNTQTQVYRIAVTTWTVVYIITLVFAIGVLLLDKGDPVKTLSWIIVMLIIPGLGMVFYNFFGASFKEEGRPKRDYDETRQLTGKYVKLLDEILDYKVRDLLKISDSDIAYKNIHYLYHDPGSTLFKNTRSHLLVDGKETFDSIKESLR